MTAARAAAWVGLAALVAGTVLSGLLFLAAEATKPPSEAVARPCAAAMADDLKVYRTYADIDRPGESWSAGPSGSGRLIDSEGVPVPRTRLRFWSRTSIQTEDTDESGDFDVHPDVPEATYDVDAILSYPHPDNRRIHVGMVTAGEHDVVLRLPIPQLVVASGVLVDEADRLCSRWEVSVRPIHAAEAAGSPFASSTTESGGRFRIMAWRKSRVALQAQRPGGGRRAIIGAAYDSETGETRFTVGPPRVAGRVIVEDGGAPDGAIVRLRRAEGGTERNLCVPPSGEFVFEGLDETAIYVLRAELGGFLQIRPVECTGDEAEVRLHLFGLGTIVEGRAVDAGGAPLRFAWLRFVAADAEGDRQTLTEVDGTFRTFRTRDVDYDVVLLVPGADGRLVPGPALGRCRGGAKGLELRPSR